MNKLKDIVFFKSNFMKNVICFIVLMSFSYVLINIFNIIFSVPDDYIINNIITGAYGDDYDSQILYINNLLGVWLKFFYRVIPFINIYTFHLILTISLCFTVIINEVIKNKKYILLCVVFILYIITLFNITFTVVAYLSAIVGFVNLIFKKNSHNYVLGDFLIVNGALIRFTVLEPIIFSFAVLVLFKIIKEKDKKFILNMVLLFILVMSCNMIGKYLYARDDILKEFREYHKVSSSIRDYKKIDYEKYKDLMEEIQWSENDLELFYTFNFADKEKYSVENMNYIVNNIDLRDRYNLDIIRILKNSCKQILIYSILEILILILLVKNLKKCKNRIQSIWVLISSVLMCLLLIIRDRTPFRVMYPEYLLILVFFLFSLCDFPSEDSKQLSKKKIIINSVCCILTVGLITGYCTKYYITAKKYKEQEILNHDTIEQLNDNSAYIIEIQTGNKLTMNYKISERKQIGEYKKLIRNGGGDVFSKRYYNYLETFNLSEKDCLLKNLLNEDVYYIGAEDEEIQKNVELQKQYLKENVNPDGVLEEYKKINDMIIYKYRVNID